MSDAIEQFRHAIGAAGLEVPDTINPDGAIHRFSTNGKRGDDSGWYVLHGDDVPAGSFGCWRTGLQSSWFAKSECAMTAAERQTQQARCKVTQALHDAEQAQRQRQARGTAAALWQAGTPATVHDYLTRKGIKPHGVKCDGQRLVIPLRDTVGQIHSLQTIAPDGGKRFMPGGRVSGCYFSVGKPMDNKLIVCEGYATGASIHEATGQAVAVAFNAGNLTPVAMALRKKYPDIMIVVAADDDWCTPNNPGLNAARQAALAVGGLVAVPRFPAQRPEKATDFNDLQALAGFDAVRGCFAEIEEVAC